MIEWQTLSLSESAFLGQLYCIVYCDLPSQLQQESSVFLITCLPFVPVILSYQRVLVLEGIWVAVQKIPMQFIMHNLKHIREWIRQWQICFTIQLLRYFASMSIAITNVIIQRKNLSWQDLIGMRLIRSPVGMPRK